MGETTPAQESDLAQAYVNDLITVFWKVEAQMRQKEKKDNGGGMNKYSRERHGGYASTGYCTFWRVSSLWDGIASV